MSDYCSDVFKDLVMDWISNNIPEKSRVVVFFIFLPNFAQKPIYTGIILEKGFWVISDPSLNLKDFFERKKTHAFFLYHQLC